MSEYTPEELEFIGELVAWACKQEGIEVIVREKKPGELEKTLTEFFWGDRETVHDMD